MDVCIIGAGWSGLYACKYALENGLTPIVLEKRSAPGGVWNYSDDPKVTTVMKSTVSSSSRLVTEASDFFMDESVGEFMHHEEIREYLDAYVRKFNLQPYLNFDADVQSVRKVDRHWQITWRQHGETKTTIVDRVAVCAGRHSKQREIGEPISNFSGEVIHAGNIKQIARDDFTDGDHVVVYGGGETASDIIDLLVQTPAKITWAIRGGQHFLRKTLFRQRSGIGQFDKHDFALDTIASPLINGLSSFSKGAPGRRYLTDWLSTGSVTKYQGHGVPVWKNEHRYAQMFFNKNGHSVDFIHSGRVQPQNNIVDVRGDQLHFKSGNVERCTHVTCCFGYEFHCPFLPEPYRQGDIESMYQYVFPVDDPTIAFLGYARPIIGSIPLVTEMQCLWAFRVFSGKVELPDEAELVRRQEQVQAKWAGKLPGKGSLQSLVLPSTYVTMMLKEAYPNRSPGDHFWKKPLRAIKFLSWIPSGSIRFAVDPDIPDQRFNELWKQRRHGWFLAWVLPIIILISRLLHIETIVDWWVQRHEEKQLRRRARSRKQEQSEQFQSRVACRRAA